MRGQGRIFGVETEFGCLVVDEALGKPEVIVEEIKDHVFYERRLGAIDLHARDEVFEPSRSGGFLLNGARLYVDAVGSHLEYATAECQSLKDLVANDRAGQRIITQAIRELGLDDSVAIYNNSVDHFGGHTFGCHENILARIDDDFFGHTIQYLIPFLVTRQIFSGVGRVGGHVLSSAHHLVNYDDVVANPVDYIWVSNVYGVEPDPRVRFQLSQRADHILKTVASRVRFNRSLVNPKWEHFYSHNQLQRLHLLFGESNQMEFAYALKIGTTVLAMRLVEDEIIPDSILLANPLRALREVSRDESYTWQVTAADGSKTDALSVQNTYCELAQGYRGESDEIDWVLDNWVDVLNQLKQDPMELASKLDWVAKKKIVEQYLAETGVSWDDDSLHSVDLEYHNIDPAQSLFHALQEAGETERYVSNLDITDAMTEPPQDTRALGRSKIVRKVLDSKKIRTYVFDWNAVLLANQGAITLDDPFETYAEVADDL